MMTMMTMIPSTAMRKAAAFETTEESRWEHETLAMAMALT